VALRWRYLIGFLVLGAVAITGMTFMHALAPSTGGVDLARAKSSEKGVYVVEIAPEVGTFKQGELHAWVVTLKTAEGAPVEGARIAVDGGMPDHGHGLPTSPQVTTYLGGGRYRVEGVKFNMSGLWELKFAIAAPQGDDQAVFNLML
jgi:hypothetical protein